MNVYVDHRMTGANRARPGLREALAAVRAGDTLLLKNGRAKAVRLSTLDAICRVLERQPGDLLHYEE